VDTRDFVLLSLDAFGREIDGRTLFQKRLYFLAALAGKEVEFGFHAHYYGPYSAAVADALGELKALGFVEETRIPLQGRGTGGFERNLFKIRLTDAGLRLAEHKKQGLDPRDTELLARADEIKSSPAGRDYAKLSMAAKVYYIMGTRPQDTWNKDTVANEAERLGWSVEENAAVEAADFLEKLGLIRTVTPPESN
jgi:uncharacterized protein YwgA